MLGGKQRAREQKTLFPKCVLTSFFLAVNPVTHLNRPILCDLRHTNRHYAYPTLSEKIQSQQPFSYTGIGSLNAGIDGLLQSRPFDTLFALPLMDGLCLGVKLPDAGDSDTTVPLNELHTLEAEKLAGMRPHRQITFAGGRIAMRRAIEAVGAGDLAQSPLLFDEFGAPTVSSRILGSISHSEGLVVGFVRSVESFGGACLAHNSLNKSITGRAGKSRCAVGVDVENALRPIKLKLAKRTLAYEERQTLGVPARSLSAESDLLLRISIKEALYKALHPLVRQAIRWHSVQVQPKFDGTCVVNATELEREVNGTIVAAASWRLQNGSFLSCATAVFTPRL